MRKKTSKTVEQARIKTGKFGTDESYGNNGFFTFKIKGRELKVIASDELGWDHVSVSLKHRCPTWNEMCAIKNIFFEPSETVVQFHPPESVYINNHPFTLHLWRNQSAEIELPPINFV